MKKNGVVVVECLWEKVPCEIKAIDENFPFSRNEIMRKFLNFMATYKRIKNKLFLGVYSNNSVKFLEIMFFFIIDSSISKSKVASVSKSKNNAMNFYYKANNRVDYEYIVLKW